MLGEIDYGMLLAADDRIVLGIGNSNATFFAHRPSRHGTRSP
jgi:hypothetical protein